MARIETLSIKIGGIISQVDKIALQTNLLALNAGIKAARSGGRTGISGGCPRGPRSGWTFGRSRSKMKQLIQTFDREDLDRVRCVRKTGEELTGITGRVEEITT